MAPLVDYALALLVLTSCWYGLATGRLVRGVLAVGVGTLANAGLLLSLDAAYIALLSAMLALLLTCSFVLLLLGQGAPRRALRPPKQKRFLAAVLALVMFSVAAAALVLSQYPVPVLRAEANTAVRLGATLLTEHRSVLLALALTLVTALVAAAWIVAPRSRRRASEEDAEEATAPVSGAVRLPREHHRQGG